MAKAMKPFRALRHVLWSGAIAGAWLAFSAPGAIADSPEVSSVLAGTTTAISSTADAAGGAMHAAGAPVDGLVSPVPPGQPVLPESRGGLSQPVVSPRNTAIDDMVSYVPVVNQVLPEAPVAAVVSPVVVVADRTVGAAAGSALAPVADSVSLVRPVITPVTDVLTGIRPLPEIGVPGADPLPAVSAPTADAGIPASSAVVVPDAPAPSTGTPQSRARHQTPASSSTTGPLGLGLFSGAGLAPVQSQAMAIPADGLPASAMDGLLGPAGALPSGTTPASGQQSGPSGAAAWLSSASFRLPITGLIPAIGPSAQFPSPVSFDPGSSPD